MSKFKVGDKVRILSDALITVGEVEAGDLGTITEILEGNLHYPYQVKTTAEGTEVFGDSELELVETGKSETPQEGVWVVWHESHGYQDDPVVDRVFALEIDALRVAVADKKNVKFVEYGEVFSG